MKMKQRRSIFAHFYYWGFWSGMMGDVIKLKIYKHSPQFKRKK